MAPKEKQIRFRMDTEAFISIWVNHCSSPSADDWKRFVGNCFERFTEETEKYNRAQLDEHDANWGAWTDDVEYEFLSERCYAKCMTVRSKLMKDKGFEPPMPMGYKSRNGSKAPKRITTDRMYDLFQGK
jgi:hypothetical protein